MKGLKKTVLAVCMAVVLGLWLVPVSALASEAVKTVEITIDGEPFTQDSTTGFAVVKVDSPIVPLPLLRGVLESLGIKFEWQADGDYLITLTKGDKKVYHQRGKSVTSADNPYNEGGAKEILATGNVPSYHDIKANTLMIDLRLILDSFASEGISVEWLRTSPETAGTVAIYINSPDPVAYVTPERPEPESTTENGDEIIWLDENTSVNKTKLL
ncbi:MAG: hypothetical protein LBR74_02940, partial [Eubacterium sp.]|nr:hypothetical protein [Eubacterium sp.]